MIMMIMIMMMMMMMMMMMTVNLIVTPESDSSIHVKAICFV